MVISFEQEIPVEILKMQFVYYKILHFFKQYFLCVGLDTESELIVNN